MNRLPPSSAPSTPADDTPATAATDHGFRRSLPPWGLSDAAEPVLSDEHSRAAFVPLDEPSAVQRRRVEDCLRFDGVVASAKF